MQRQETTAYQLGLLHRQYWGSSTIDMLLYYQKGMPWWQAEPGLTDQVEGTATTRYSLYGLNLNIAAPVKLGKVQGGILLTSAVSIRPMFCMVQTSSALADVIRCGI